MEDMPNPPNQGERRRLTNRREVDKRFHEALEPMDTVLIAREKAATERDQQIGKFFERLTTVIDLLRQSAADELAKRKNR
jgi:hypothetical protein